MIRSTDEMPGPRWPPSWCAIGSNKEGLLSPNDAIWFIWTNVRSTLRHAYPRLAKVWTPQGAVDENFGNGEIQKREEFDAVDFASRQLIFHLSTCKGEDAFMTFLEHLA